MLKQYKNTLILSSLVILLPIPVQLLLGREWNTMLLLPLFLLAVHWFCVYWTMKDPKQKNQGRKPTLIILWIMPVLSLFITSIDFALVSGLDFSISTVFCLLFGLMFLIIGNYLPKVKQNSSLGVKVCWTYTSEENWNATHRYAGKLWVIGGIVMTLGAFLPETWALGLMLVVIVLMCTLPVLYSYRYYRMQNARGDALTEAPAMFRMDSKFGKLSLVLLALVLVFVAVLMFTGDIEYRFESDRFTVEADFYDDLVLVYDVIESIEYRGENVAGARAWGYGSARLLMGTFRNEEFGTYTRYTYTDPGSAVVLTTMKETYVLSAENEDATRQLYDTLMEKIEK